MELCLVVLKCHQAQLLALELLGLPEQLEPSRFQEKYYCKSKLPFIDCAFTTTSLNAVKTACSDLFAPARGCAGIIFVIVSPA
jgi:hypothetical protein